MKEVHLTSASISGARCLREMKASTNKRRRDTTYTSKRIVEPAVKYFFWLVMIERNNGPGIIERNNGNKKPTELKDIGNPKAILVRTTEETRHIMASALEGKSKNHPTQCIPPNTPPTTDIQMRRVPKFSESDSAV